MNFLNVTVLMWPALDPFRAESGVGLQPSYEAWVIYNFLSLCMAYVGGPGQVLVHMEAQNIKVGRSRHPSHSRSHLARPPRTRRWEVTYPVVNTERSGAVRV